MVPRIVAHEFADAVLDRSRNVAKSWAAQDSIHWPKVCAATVIRAGTLGTR